MIDPSSVGVTGGSGLLGTQLKQLLPGAWFPTSLEFNVADYAQMAAHPGLAKVQTLVHGAAFTSPPKVDREPVKALQANIVGTANVVRLCVERNLRLIYISTDYVFRGDRGGYAEEDDLHPVNKYAWSKLGGECAVRLYDRSLIVRTTFGPRPFPYEKAFVDQWTSRECVDAIAAKLVKCLESDLTGVVHLGGPRRTVMDYAKSLDPAREIKPLSTSEVGFAVPKDTSLDVSKYNRSVGGLTES